MSQKAAIPEPPPTQAPPPVVLKPEIKPKLKESKKAPPPAKVAEVPKETHSSRAEEGLVIGDAYEKAVKQMMDMGFMRDEVEGAMQAAFNNPDRAVDYLINVLFLYYA